MYLDDDGSMFHQSVGIQLSDLDALDRRLLKTLRDNNLDDMLYVMYQFLCDYSFFRKLGHRFMQSRSMLMLDQYVLKLHLPV
jgi:hypothetical protein